MTLSTCDRCGAVYANLHAIRSDVAEIFVR
jgi:hypothetical protein